MPVGAFIVVRFVGSARLLIEIRQKKNDKTKIIQNLARIERVTYKTRDSYTKDKKRRTDKIVTQKKIK